MLLSQCNLNRKSLVQIIFGLSVCVGSMLCIAPASAANSSTLTHHYIDQDARDSALEQALTKAATEPHSKRLNLADLVWLASMSDRLEKRLPNPLYRVRLLKAVLNESRATGLDPQLVLALIDVESSFRRDAVSKSGAVGLMQVMPFWSAVFDKPAADLSNPLVSVRFGCNILRHYVDRYDNVRNALAAYNGSLGLSVYPDKVIARYHKKWRYDVNQTDPLSLEANTRAKSVPESAKTDALGLLVLPDNQIALTLRPAPVVVERTVVAAMIEQNEHEIADTRIAQSSFYDSQPGQ